MTFSATMNWTIATAERVEAVEAVAMVGRSRPLRVAAAEKARDPRQRRRRSARLAAHDFQRLAIRRSISWTTAPCVAPCCLRASVVA